MSDASRIVERLHKKNLIKRVVSNKDRRSVDIGINSMGLKLLEESDAKVKDFEKLLDNLSDSEITNINICLDKLRQSKKPE